MTWAQYRASIGDRSGLFAALVEAWPVDRALYVGSYVDLSPSTAIGSVTYVDTDGRAATFFSEAEAVRADLHGRVREEAGGEVRFLHADYTEPLDVADASIDLLVSLFTTPAWESCRRYVRPGGLLLANTSHGEASLAALDPGLRLVAAVPHRGDRYRLVTEGLEGYLVPKRPDAADAERIRASGRGIAYTKTAFAYLFQAR